MSAKCRNSASNGGIHVEAHSGIGNRDICSLAGRTDIKHIVKITSLILYDAAVSCDGIISSIPNQVEFSGTQVGITPNKWSSTGSMIADGKAHIYDYVHLNPVGSGSESVRAEVDVTWLEPNQKSNISVSITVSV